MQKGCVNAMAEERGPLSPLGKRPPSWLRGQVMWLSVRHHLCWTEQRTRGRRAGNPSPNPVVGRDHALNHGPRALPPGGHLGVWGVVTVGKGRPQPPLSLGERGLPSVPCVPPESGYGMELRTPFTGAIWHWL